MEILEYIIGGLLLVLAIALVAIIGLQQSKRKSGLGNSIAGQGASESYLTRNKIASRESTYKKATLIIAIVFVVLVLALYIVGSIDPSEESTSSVPDTSDIIVLSDAESSVAESAAESAAESVAESSATEVSE